MSRCLASLAIGLVVCSFPASAFGAEDRSAEESLKKHGLRRSGMTYVLPAEAEFQKKLNQARALYQRLTFAQVLQREFEQGVSDTRLMVQQLTQQRIMLNQQLSRVTTVQENNRLVAMINQLDDQINLINQRSADPATRKQIGSQVPVQREAFMEAVLDLRRFANGVTETYEGLAKDEEVKSALDALNQESKVKLTLGPSRSFRSNVKLLEKVESSVLSETVELRREGDIYWVDVTFNGKITKPLAFDTGASSVVLPASLAAEIGLKPGKDDPIVRAQVADGSIVEAKQMTIPSVRVGTFTVKDVICVVMSADKKDVPPLLGQTFLKNFTHQFSGETGTLVISRVETPEAGKVAPRAKTSARPSKAKRQAPAIERSPDASGLK